MIAKTVKFDPRSTRLILGMLIVVILVAPWVAMQFTDEVAWTRADFIAATILLGGGALAVEIAMRVTRAPLRRLFAVAAIGILVAAIWAQGAVGIF